MDLLVNLNGKDGSFLHPPVIANEIWKQQEGKDGQWTAYGTQIPVDIKSDGKLDILLAGSWGQWGAWTMDRKLTWTFNPDKSKLAHYAARGLRTSMVTVNWNSVLFTMGRFFRCYDATNGNLKWELKESSRLLTLLPQTSMAMDGRNSLLDSRRSKQLDQTSGKTLWEVGCTCSARTRNR